MSMRTQTAPRVTVVDSTTAWSTSMRAKTATMPMTATVEVASDVIQLGSVTDPAGTTGLIAPASPASGDTVRVDTGTADVDVQWQMQNAMMEWMDLADETGKTLSLTDGQAGRMVRAKVTYMGDDENPDHVTWVEYSALANVAATVNCGEQRARANSGDSGDSCQPE